MGLEGSENVRAFAALFGLAAEAKICPLSQKA